LPEDCLKLIYLRHSFSKNRHFFSLYVDAVRELDFVVVNPARKGQSQLEVNLQTVFTQTLDDVEGVAELFADWRVASQHYVGELSDALKQIEARLREYKEKNKQATLVVLQSGKTTEELQLSGLTSLLNEFPVLRLSVLDGDNDFPSLDWIRHACRRSVESHYRAC